MSQTDETSDTAQSLIPTKSETTTNDGGSSSGTLHSKSGWDGKLRVDKEKKAVLVNPEAFSDPEYSDEDAPPVDEIEADEGG
jgi:protein phosphatase 1 regulatory subunit 7